MKRCLYILLLFNVAISTASIAQERMAFSRISKEDGIGLASNKVKSLYQDNTGYIWVGTANGLQRFDGNKFIQFGNTKGDALPYDEITQIIPVDSSLLIAVETRREFGLFNPYRFTYQKIQIQTNHPLPARFESHVWKSSAGKVYLNIHNYGTLTYNSSSNTFEDNNPFRLPRGWKSSLYGVFEDTEKQQIWICTDSGLSVFDLKSKQNWNKHYNPRNLPLLNNHRLQDKPSEIFIDSKRRTWVFGWPVWGGGGQYRFCFDSLGRPLALANSLNEGPVGYAETRRFLETSEGVLWVYGANTLFHFDPEVQAFVYERGSDSRDMNIRYDRVFEVIEDKEGNIWMATDDGLYYTRVGAADESVANIILSANTIQQDITDILQTPDGDIWLTSWGAGVIRISRQLQKLPNYVYESKPPASWAQAQKNAVALTWAVEHYRSSNTIWIGCNGGVVLVHHPEQKTTNYLNPPEFGNSTVRFIVEHNNDLWFGTQSGKLVRYRDGRFAVMQDVGSIIYKIFFAANGNIWLATHEKGIYEIRPDGRIIRQFNTANGLYQNTVGDIEELNDSTIVAGAGALNFINRKNGNIRWLSYKEGLPSNSAARLRMDDRGFLWIITSNGLSRYNPANNRITSYGRRDGVVAAEKTNMADYRLQDGRLIFGGSNHLLLFHPATFVNNAPPPDVTITDFKLFNQYLPLDSLLQQDVIKLKPDQNSISIFFASLSFSQRDKLTYHYQMKGISDEWIVADGTVVNFSLLPPGKYTFSVYCENLEGVRSRNITEIRIEIIAPFWATWWFASSLMFLLLLIIYFIHRLRVNRLLAVEAIRSRVARDLHDDMGSTLSTINILSAMAKSKMATDPVKTSEFLGKISDNSQRMMEAMDDIVWSIKPANDSMQKIIARMREFATNVLEAKDIELQMDVADDVQDVKLNMETRRDFFLVFKEAVNNAAKYSRATLVTVKMEISHRHLVLQVNDNGRGFQVETADSGNGLGNMQKRTEAMDGRLSINSKPGMGTRIKIIIPL